MFVCSDVHNDKHIIEKKKTQIKKLIPIRELVSSIRSDTAEALLGYHALTGCETVSAFTVTGKIKIYKIMRDESKSVKFLPLFKALGSNGNVEHIVRNSLASCTRKTQ